MTDQQMIQTGMGVQRQVLSKALNLMHWTWGRDGRWRARVRGTDVTLVQCEREHFGKYDCIGVHRVCTNLDDIQDAIESAERDNFPRVCIY